jgi:hypothetical protein
MIDNKGRMPFFIISFSFMIIDNIEDKLNG